VPSARDTSFAFRIAFLLGSWQLESAAAEGAGSVSAE